MRRKALAAIVLIPEQRIAEFVGGCHINITITIQVYGVDSQDTFGVHCDVVRYEDPATVILTPIKPAVIRRTGDHIHVPVLIHIDSHQSAKTLIAGINGARLIENTSACTWRV